MRRPTQSSGDDRPTWADAAETGRGSRSSPPVPRSQPPVCLLRVGRARLPPQPRALAPARASPEKSQSRPRACPLPEQPGSQRARYQPQARPVARQPHGQARRRTGRQQSRQPTTPRIDPPKPRTSSTWQYQSTSKRSGVRLGERPVTRPGRGCSSPPPPLSPCLTTKDGAFMEPRGCNQWQSTANRLSAEAVKTSQIRCDRLPPV